MSFSTQGHLDNSRRRHGAAGGVHDSLPTPDLALLDQTPTPTVAQVMSENDLAVHNPFDALFRRAIGSPSDPQSALLNAPSISVSTPNTADLLAMLGGAMTGNEIDVAKSSSSNVLGDDKVSKVSLDIDASNYDAAMKSAGNPLAIKTDNARRSPKKGHLFRQNSITQNDAQFAELQTQAQPTANYTPLGGLNAGQSQSMASNDGQATAPKARLIGKKRTSLSIILPGNSATSPIGDIPSVSSSTDESAMQATAISNTAGQLLVPNRQYSQTQLGEAFLAQFEQRDGVQTPTTAEVINTAMEIADGSKLRAAYNNPLAIAMDAIGVSAPQRGAHANVNVNSLPQAVPAAKLVPVRPASNSNPSTSASGPAPTAANTTLLTAGGQMILVPANFLSSSQQSNGPVYIIAQPNGLGTTQLIPAASNAIILPQMQQSVNLQQSQTQSASANASRAPSAKEALKRAINQPKGSSPSSVSNVVDNKSRRLAVTSGDRRNDAKTTGFLLQHAAVDSTTRLANAASSQLAMQNAPVTISINNTAFPAASNNVAFAPVTLPHASASSATTASTSHSEGHSPGDTELVRRQRFLERNRAAAARCRQRRKHFTETLQGEVTELKQIVHKQSNQVTSLKKQISHLKLLLLAHKDCPVTDEQSRQGLFTALVPADLDSTPNASTPESSHPARADTPPSTSARALSAANINRVDETLSDADPDALNADHDDATL